jgi:hypothetical protein
LGQQLAAGPLPRHLQQFADDTVRAIAAALTGDPTDQAIVAALALADGSRLDIAEIEGRLIGGQTEAEIADALRLPVETVTAYIAVFFDLWQLLKYRGALRAIAIGQIGPQTPTPVQAILWAGFHFDGPLAGLVADYFRRGFGDGRRITGIPDLDAETCATMRSVRK